MKSWLALALLLVLSGCGRADSTTLNVYAAASLTQAFTAAAKKFEAEHEGVQVRLNFGGSADLVAQIEQGAPADVFASADTATMDKAGEQVERPELFASNTLMIAVPPDNPGRVRTLADLARPGVLLVTCAPQVPCGAAAAKVERLAGLRFSPVSEEQSVSGVLAKVSAGEADAGLVYVTDVRAAGDTVRGIRFAEAARAVNHYPIAVVKQTQQAELAGEFVDLVTSEQGQRILAAAGFGKP